MNRSRGPGGTHQSLFFTIRLGSKQVVRSTNVTWRTTAARRPRLRILEEAWAAQVQLRNATWVIEETPLRAVRLNHRHLRTLMETGSRQEDLRRLV